MTERLNFGRLLGYAGLLVLGALVGLAGSLVQAGWFPGGLLLALLAVAGVTYGGVTATGTRTGGAVAGAGWLLAVVLALGNRPEGDFLFPAGLTTYVFLLGGMVLAVMCATLAGLPQPRGGAGRLGN
ncbi:DUF6113 family protein [Streptomyces orinoci]|uniref:DUF6113 family protein n=1 Tax=Streptomyces orinoci TaxID=67339 RepID=A0ABV3JSM0_STRON|nr:DUF6113 family protein [Streptomyces orinoci]